MDTVLDRQWTSETFLAWEDQQEGKYEFDGFRVIPTTGGSVAHQVIVFNLCVLLARLRLEGSGRPLSTCSLPTRTYIGSRPCRIGWLSRHPEM